MLKDKIPFISVLLLCALLLAGCKPQDPKALTPAGSADIYAVVIRQIAAADGNQRSILYVLSTTNDMASRDKNRLFQPIAEEVQKGISERLQDHPFRISWVANNDEVPWENGRQVKDGNALITLGNLYPQADGSVHVSVGLTIGNVSGFGKTYVVEQRDGVWTVTGTTGPEWIS